MYKRVQRSTSVLRCPVSRAPLIRSPSQGGFDEGVLKARFEVAINVADATEDLDSGATVLDAHPYLGDTPIDLLLFGAEFAPLGFLL